MCCFLGICESVGLVLTTLVLSTLGAYAIKALYLASLQHRDPSLYDAFNAEFWQPSGAAFWLSFVIIALLLLEIPEVRARFGLNVTQGEKYATDTVRRDVYFKALAGREEIKSPLLWLSGRLARNRELLGVHYPSDSSASRHLARNIWKSLFAEGDPETLIDCPSLMRIVNRAKAEWTD